MIPKRPDARLSATLPDPIADRKWSGKFLRLVKEMAAAQEAAKRNV